MMTPDFSTPEFSTIAQLLFPNDRTLDFARIVAELETVLGRLRGDTVQITWDCDDLVAFDMPETRILLAWTELEATGLQGCLTVSVGPGPSSAIQTGDAEHESLCSRLVERIQHRFVPAAVIWRQVEGSIDAELVDGLIDILPDINTILPSIDGIVESISKTDLSKSSHPETVQQAEVAELQSLPLPKITAAKPTANIRPLPDILMPANDVPDLPQIRSEELDRLRKALYPSVAANSIPSHSTQMRLAAHCLNATLILVWSPLGAAVMTYSILKGEDIRFSSRMMAVAGTLFGLAHTPIGQTVAAMAGVA
ncbi:MAG: hypothetical protein ABIV25_08655 [Paracoccaceae bacterium]